MLPSDPNTNEEEVLLAFSVEPKRDRSTLLRYLAQYPEHASALIDCSLELLTLPTEISPVWVADSAVEAGWQEFRAQLGAAAEAGVESPFAKLTPSAFKGLAVRLGINNLLLLRIRDRGIRAASIPGAFMRQLATELGAPLKAVTDYLAGPPCLAPSSAFRSPDKPVAASQVDFPDAVRTSQLTVEQQKKLLTMGN
jgi:hypothetical protein